jgi:hypothetical protein
MMRPSHRQEVAMSAELKQSPAIATLAEGLRDKALEYAAALGARGPRPTTVLGTAVTLAKEWQSGRLPEVGDADRGVALLVQPRQGRWIIRRANAAEATHVFSLRDDAVRRAQELSRQSASPVFVFGPGGTLLERYAPPAPADLRPPPARPAVRPIARPIARPAVVRPVEVAPSVVAPPVVAPPVVAPPVVAPAVPVATLEAPLAPEPIVDTPAVEIAAAPAPEVSATPEIAADDTLLVAVRKSGRKWAVVEPSGAKVLFPTRRKAIAHAESLATELGARLDLA